MDDSLLSRKVGCSRSLPFCRLISSTTLPFRQFRITQSFPFLEFPLAFFALIECNDVRQDAPGDVFDLVLRNTGIVDELLPASQVAKLPPIFQFLYMGYFTDGSVIGWHGSFPR